MAGFWNTIKVETRETSWIGVFGGLWYALKKAIETRENEYKKVEVLSIMNPQVTKSRSQKKWNIWKASKIAVIENEIGALGVDGSLVANAHTEANWGDEL